jgi:hypothetical protein
MPRLDIVTDTRTTRLIAAAREAQAAEHLPKESARPLVALSRGARLYLEAVQPAALATRTLGEIDDLMAGADEELTQVFKSSGRGCASSTDQEGVMERSTCQPSKTGQPQGGTR